MKFSQSILSVVVLVAETSAFPSMMYGPNGVLRGPGGPLHEYERRMIGEAEKFEVSMKEKRAGTPLATGFNAEQQYVSTTGDYAFVKPDLSTDLRGPCPGLNAMANHGYIPHNGVATIDQFVKGTGQVFGMGADLATFLAVYGAVFDGDLTSWSIGGPPPAGLLSTVGLLGTPQGISGSHNVYESDVSPTRPDLYEYGNDYKVITSQFEEMYEQPLGPNGYDLSTLTEFRAKRFQESIDNNPYFFNGPFSGVTVQPAAYTFIYRFMANKSAEYPEGYLDGDVLKSFFSITGEQGSFVWTEGNERIPDNWYRRAVGDEYTIPFFLTDQLAAATQYPEFLSVGGNTGTTDSFAGVDVSMLTAGVFDSASLLEGDNLACFAYQFAQQAAPDILRGLFADITDAMNTLTTAVDNALASFTCPQLKSIDTSQFAAYPGSKGSY